MVRHPFRWWWTSGGGPVTLLLLALAIPCATSIAVSETFFRLPLPPPSEDALQVILELARDDPVRAARGLGDILARQSTSLQSRKIALTTFLSNLDISATSAWGERKKQQWISDQPDALKRELELFLTFTSRLQGSRISEDVADTYLSVLQQRRGHYYLEAFRGDTIPSFTKVAQFESAWFESIGLIFSSLADVAKNQNLPEAIGRWFFRVLDRLETQQKTTQTATAKYAMKKSISSGVFLTTQQQDVHLNEDQQLQQPLDAQLQSALPLIFFSCAMQNFAKKQESQPRGIPPLIYTQLVYRISLLPLLSPVLTAPTSSPSSILYHFNRNRSSAADAGDEYVADNSGGGDAWGSLLWPLTFWRYSPALRGDVAASTKIFQAAVARVQSERGTYTDQPSSPTIPSPSPSDLVVSLLGSFCKCSASPPRVVEEVSSQFYEAYTSWLQASADNLTNALYELLQFTPLEGFTRRYASCHSSSGGADEGQSGAEQERITATATTVMEDNRSQTGEVDSIIGLQGETLASFLRGLSGVTLTTNQLVGGHNSNKIGAGGSDLSEVVVRLIRLASSVNNTRRKSTPEDPAQQQQPLLLSPSALCSLVGAGLSTQDFTTSEGVEHAFEHFKVVVKEANFLPPYLHPDTTGASAASTADYKYAVVAGILRVVRSRRPLTISSTSPSAPAANVGGAAGAGGSTFLHEAPLVFSRLVISLGAGDMNESVGIQMMRAYLAAGDLVKADASLLSRHMRMLLLFTVGRLFDDAGKGPGLPLSLFRGMWSAILQHLREETQISTSSFTSPDRSFRIARECLALTLRGLPMAGEDVTGIASPPKPFLALTIPSPQRLANIRRENILAAISLHLFRSSLSYLDSEFPQPHLNPRASELFVFLLATPNMSNRLLLTLFDNLLVPSSRSLVSDDAQHRVIDLLTYVVPPEKEDAIVGEDQPSMTEILESAEGQKAAKLYSSLIASRWLPSFRQNVAGVVPIARVVLAELGNRYLPSAKSSGDVTGVHLSATFLSMARELWKTLLGPTLNVQDTNVTKGAFALSLTSLASWHHQAVLLRKQSAMTSTSFSSSACFENFQLADVLTRASYGVTTFGASTIATKQKAATDGLLPSAIALVESRLRGGQDPTASSPSSTPKQHEGSDADVYEIEIVARLLFGVLDKNILLGGYFVGWAARHALDVIANDPSLTINPKIPERQIAIPLWKLLLDCFLPLPRESATSSSAAENGSDLSKRAAEMMDTTRLSKTWLQLLLFLPEALTQSTIPTAAEALQLLTQRVAVIRLTLEDTPASSPSLLDDTTASSHTLIANQLKRSDDFLSSLFEQATAGVAGWSDVPFKTSLIQFALAGYIAGLREYLPSTANSHALIARALAHALHAGPRPTGHKRMEGLIVAAIATMTSREETGKLLAPPQSVGSVVAMVYMLTSRMSPSEISETLGTFMKRLKMAYDDAKEAYLAVVAQVRLESNTHHTELLRTLLVHANPTVEQTAEVLVGVQDIALKYLRNASPPVTPLVGGGTMAAMIDSAAAYHQSKVEGQGTLLRTELVRLRVTRNIQQQREPLVGFPPAASDDTRQDGKLPTSGDPPGGVFAALPTLAPPPFQRAGSATAQEGRTPPPPPSSATAGGGLFGSFATRAPPPESDQPSRPSSPPPSEWIGSGLDSIDMLSFPSSGGLTSDQVQRAIQDLFPLPNVTALTLPTFPPPPSQPPPGTFSLADLEQSAIGLPPNFPEV